MTKRSYSLRNILLFWLLTPLIIFYAGRAAYTFHFSSDLASQIYDRNLYTIAHALAQQVGLKKDRSGFTLPRSAQEMLLAVDGDGILFSLRNASGTTLLGDASVPAPPAELQCAESCYFDSVIDGTKNRVLLIHGSPTHDVLPFDVSLLVAETYYQRGLLTKEVISNFLIPQILTVMIIAVVVWIGVGKGLAPLRDLQAALARRSHLDLRPVDEMAAPDEVRPLISSINDLIRRLAGALDAQNRFIADAAHQLRTPLAGMKTQIDYALRETNPESRLHAIQQAHASADRLIHLVNQLLSLAHGEPAAERLLKMTPTDVTALLSEVTTHWVPAAMRKRIDLGFESDGGSATIVCDSARLKELVNNLIDNALRYTQEGGHVTVRINASTQPPVLSIIDDGPGIRTADMERVFERFYRVLGTGQEGSGLGLAIVKDIARVHHWQVTLTSNSPARGTTVSVLFTAPQITQGV